MYYLLRQFYDAHLLGYLSGQPLLTRITIFTLPLMQPLECLIPSSIPPHLDTHFLHNYSSMSTQLSPLQSPQCQWTMDSFDFSTDDSFIPIEPTTNIFRQYRDQNTGKFQTLTARDFIRIWKYYDADGKSIFYSTQSVLLTLCRGLIIDILFIKNHDDCMPSVY